MLFDRLGVVELISTQREKQLPCAAIGSLQREIFVGAGSSYLTSSSSMSNSNVARGGMSGGLPFSP